MFYVVEETTDMVPWLTFRAEDVKKRKHYNTDRETGEVFSGKPSMVSVSDDGKIRHNGKSKGRVYRIADKVTTHDIYEHPESSMKKGWEWVTKKEFKLEFLYEYDVLQYPDDILSESETRKIREHQVSH